MTGMCLVLIPGRSVKMYLGTENVPDEEFQIRPKQFQDISRHFGKNDVDISLRNTVVLD